MATTKIWDVKAHVSKLLAYVAKKNKTTVELEGKRIDEAERLAAEILGLPPEHFATEEKKFVTGINCTPDNAKEIMLSLLDDTDKHKTLPLPTIAITDYYHNKIDKHHTPLFRNFQEGYKNILLLVIHLKKRRIEVLNLKPPRHKSHTSILHLLNHCPQNASEI